MNDSVAGPINTKTCATIKFCVNDYKFTKAWKLGEFDESMHKVITTQDIIVSYRNVVALIKIKKLSLKCDVSQFQNYAHSQYKKEKIIHSNC